ncbi:hypothetical protein [Clostridium beijerinckii]|uniref:Uncharacterized protein n=1 Tax=Clostridium beijerinckii TaxID=1520 RepID=A0AAW3W376_CLOBE|nr:hypothetical protein [Clostridium beijerinckii]MBC2455656.1 hypothetical protein [Clostridium beijerinckii]MBC2473133.1 hypothetical protein [Clostridium beijerinckii]NOV62363.1 hypothetical protein [Clostridium beijerinckii]NOV68140.1 hypothetical protein [Clostridium beijerinckii]NOW30415.1 hypothetical protein [Clostridium beijerinckii]
MYKFVSILSLLLRTYVFPNPFEKYIDFYLKNTVFINCIPQIADIFNLCFGGTILWMICYPLTGIVYNRGKNPVLGATIFFILVLINSWVLEVIGLHMYNIVNGLIEFSLCVMVETVLLGIIRCKIRYF